MTPEERADAIVDACPSGYACIEHKNCFGLRNSISEAIRAAVEEEREACALIADSVPFGHIAAAIRARGKA